MSVFVNEGECIFVNEDECVNEGECIFVNEGVIRVHIC